MATKKAVAAKKTTKRVNSFSPSKVADHTIVDADGKVVGHVRVKPSGVLWSPRDGKVWYGLSLDQFAKHATESGKKQKK
ncbi:hypothetical protein [Pseudoxanthomonas koreensis]|uniref:hypothetical protein n=1 Tax=Pseudoxanthomonas koreensis TaxID=266061 RepID=UPI001391B544|nr:hypothetical protein [Pseudoxanthomonas koreensis]